MVSVLRGPPHVDPTEQRIAYGLVEDADGDGVADRRFGVDNIPGPLEDGGWVRHRAWITDLHTGRTESSLTNADDYTVSPGGNVYTSGVGDTAFGTTFPGPPVEQPRDAPCSGLGAATSMEDPAAIVFAFGGGDSTNGGGTHRGAMPSRFYAWASTIVDGRVVATDYAPDVGWLNLSSKAPEPDFKPAVEAPIDSLEEAIAAVGQTDNMLYGFRPGDTQVPGASSWVESEARGDGWDLTFICDPNMEYHMFRGCPDGCGPIHATFHVARDGSVEERCKSQEGAKEPWRPKPQDHGVPGFSPSESEEPVAQAC